MATIFKSCNRIQHPGNEGGELRVEGDAGETLLDRASRQEALLESPSRANRGTA